MSRTRPSLPGKPQPRGQAITELALITPVLVLLVLAIVEFAGAFGARTNLQASSAQGARIGALQGNGNVVTCPALGPPDTVDMNIINAVTTTQGVNANNIAQIQIFKSAPDGTVAYSPTVTNLLANTYAITNGAATLVGTPGWRSCNRNPNEPSDSIGVRVTYVYYPILAVPGFSKFTMTDQSVQRLNPTKSSLPCPIPGVPINVAAKVATPETFAPSSYDTIWWDPVPGAAGYNIYASVNGAPYQATPVATAGASTTQITYPGNTTYAPASYEVNAYNSCGNGENSLPAANGQCPLPLPVSIISATALITTPNTDHVTWSSPGIATGVYTVTQAVSTSTTQVITVPAPTAEAYPTANSGITATYRIAEVSGCSVVGPTSLPATRVPLPPTPTPSATATNTNTSTSTPAPTGTPTATNTPTSVPTNTPVPTKTNTPVPGVPTATSAGTSTNTPVPTSTPTNTPLPTSTPTNTTVPAATATATPTNTPVVPTATPTVDLTAGLVGYWPFEEGALVSTVTDGSGNGNNGTLQGNWARVSGDKFGPTKYLTFDGSTTYVVINTPLTNMPLASDKQSISLWMNFTGNPTDGSGNGNMVALGTNGGSAVQVGFRSPGGVPTLMVWKSGGSVLVQDNKAASTYSGTGWHNVIYTFDGTTHRLYVDGGPTPVATSTALPQSATPTDLNFGRWFGNGGGEYYKGYLDGIRIYNNVVLNATQIAALQTRE